MLKYAQYLLSPVNHCDTQVMHMRHHQSWATEAMKRWSDETMKQWSDEAMKRWSDEAMKRWSDEAMKRCVEALNTS